LILPNEDFLRAAEALRLHGFTALEALPGNKHHFEGLEHYAAQYMFPPEVNERLEPEFTVALFPASLVGWKLLYVPVLDSRDKGSFTTSLAIQKIQIPETDVEQSYIQLSRNSSTSDLRDTISMASDDTASTISNIRDDSDEEYVLITPSPPARPVRRESVPMERGNGPLSPTESVCDIVDMKPYSDTGAVKMLPGQKMLEKTDGQLVFVDRGIWVPRAEGLKESFKNAAEFMGRDGTGGSQFARTLQGWGNLLGGRGSV
jgi:hypothetical protein